MSLHPLLRQILSPATEAVRYAVGGLVITAVSLLLAVIGAGFLGAAGFTILVDHVGVVEALTITGVGFLAMAVLIRLLRPVRPPPPPARPDVATQLAFDLGITLGRNLMRRKD